MRSRISRTDSTENPCDVTHFRSSELLQFQGTLDKSNWGMAPAEKRSFDSFDSGVLAGGTAPYLESFCKPSVGDCQDGIAVQLNIAVAYRMGSQGVRLI